MNGIIFGPTCSKSVPRLRSLYCDFSKIRNSSRCRVLAPKLFTENFQKRFIRQLFHRFGNTGVFTHFENFWSWKWSFKSKLVIHFCLRVRNRFPVLRFDIVIPPIICAGSRSGTRNEAKLCYDPKLELRKTWTLIRSFFWMKGASPEF